MSTVNQLTTRSYGQEQLKEEWNNLKADKAKAKDALRQVKREIPQDPEKVNNAKAEVAKAQAALKAQRNKEREFNNAEKARILGAGQTKQDTLDNPTNTDASQAENAAQTAESSTSESGSSSQSSESSASSAEQDSKKTSNSSGNSSGNSSSNSSGKKGLQLGQGFYDAVADAIVKPGAKGNTLDSASKTAKEQAQNQRNEAANRQMEAQRAEQIANQNPYAEAGKIASVQNDTENRQNVQKAGVLGAGAALARKTNAPDIQSQMAREDQQANVANQRREEADAAQQGATESEGQSDTFAIKSRDFNNDKVNSANLSMGTPEQSETKEEKAEETKEEKAEETKEEKAEEIKPEQEEPEEKPMPSGNPQHVINWLLGSSKGQDIQPQSGADGDNGLAAWVQEKYGVQPAPKWKYDSGDPTAQKWEQMWLEDSEIPGDKKAAIQALRQGRAGEGNDASKNFDSSNYDQMNKSMTVESDARIKNITACLSDLRLKFIRNAYDKNGCCSPEDFLWLAAHTGGKFSHNDREYDFFNDDDWSDDNDGSVLSGYADYIKNYVYTYKPEATQIDSRIDPNQEHIGPMAQDIEMVNPACIKETPEGVKTVDTARLAMMNAGAIGDLARQMQDLVDKLKAIGVE